VTAERWQALVSEAAENPDHGYVLLTYLQLYAPDEVSEDPAIRPHILRSARAALAPGALDDYTAEAKRDIGGLALYFVDHFQDTAAVPLVTGLMTRDSATYAHASALLIRMTGVDSVPGGPGSPAAERVNVQRFWTRWWAEHRATFEPAAKHVGQAAEARWWRRKR
jgi:hypothetical protein